MSVVLDEYSRRLEEKVRQHPEQYFWFHKKWKAVPEIARAVRGEGTRMIFRPMNLLVLRYRFIGDTILTVPFLRNLRRSHPHARIDMVVAPYSSDVLIGTPYVDEFLVYDPPTIHADSSGRHRTLLSKARFVAELRRRRYDKAYVLKRSLSSAVIAFLSGARERVGFDTEGRGLLLTKRVPYRRDQHEVLNFLDVLRADGVPVVDDHLEAWLSGEETAFADDFLAMRGGGNGARLVAIHPFSSHPQKPWHEDNFVALANALQERHGVRTLLFGGKRDRSWPHTSGSGSVPPRSSRRGRPTCDRPWRFCRNALSWCATTAGSCTWRPRSAFRWWRSSAPRPTSCSARGGRSAGS